jgi:hypothetical protein
MIDMIVREIPVFAVSRKSGREMVSEAGPLSLPV